MEGIDISIGQVGARRDIALLRVRGYLDTQTCGAMLNKITDILNKGSFHMIVDMSQVNYVSSAGWGVFVGEIKGIRENGGDLKIVQMLPEVHEIFEMLEFDRILSAYDNVEEAIDDFDLSIGLDITKSVSRTFQVENGAASSEAIAPPVRKTEKNNRAGRTTFTRSEVNTRQIPLSEQIKIIATEDPMRGIWKIKKELREDRFGGKDIGVLKIFRMLKKLNLDSKEKRVRFYRSR